MRNFIQLIILTLTSTLIVNLCSPFISSVQGASVAQQRVGALERGYRAGYSDGYRNGYRDSLDRRPSNYEDKEEYKQADFGYVASHGSLEDYRDGYQQGFEAGYNTGYELRSFDSGVPEGLTRRGAVPNRTTRNNQKNDDPLEEDDSDSITIPADLDIRVEMLTNLSTEISQRGDQFQARVLDPDEYQGTVIEGHVSRVKRAGKIKGTSELQLTFDRIRLKDGRSANFNAQLIEVVQTEDGNAGDVDTEGGISGESSTKQDAAKIGAGAGLGAIIGAIAGGGKGAAIGAIIGGAVGTGGVLATRGKDISLPRGQQLLIRTSRETMIK